MIISNRETKINDSDVQSRVNAGLVLDGSVGFRFHLALDVIFTDIDPVGAEASVQKAHRIGPYSNAIQGNIDVALSIVTR
ncbi:hypothetical protein [Advenella incenata]|nr:hypothetical protein [Advenella incenata]